MTARPGGTSDAGTPEGDHEACGTDALRAAVITVSTSASRGDREDTGGPAREAFARELGVDYVALSFVRSHTDVAALKSKIEAASSQSGALRRLTRMRRRPRADLSGL